MATHLPLMLGQTSSLTPFLIACLVVAIGMLLWDTIEVGRNDAANLINAVFGARIMTRKWALIVAAVGVMLGAWLSSDVIETARKGIFDPGMLTLEAALAVYIAVYIVDTILLYCYSAFGMPVSTTACLVFELLGASFALGGFEIVDWHVSGKVVGAIVLSVVLSGIAAFLIQRAVRGAMRERADSLSMALAHGGWIGGGMAAGLVYFMLLKGMKHVPFVKMLKADYVDNYGPAIVLLVLWALLAIAIHILLVIFRKKAARLLFPVLAIIGTFAMAFAFGQNDLANCASPGLSAWKLIENRDLGVHLASKVEIPWWALLGCGGLLVVGMTTRNAHRVTAAAVETGSQTNRVTLWAPDWCIGVARYLLRFRSREPVLAPSPRLTDQGKLAHYDPLRACVILSVAASVIASASSMGLPVSTTYVTFAAVIASGLADRIFQRGDAELKMGRAVWVIFSWFASAVIAAIAAGLVTRLIFHVGIVGMILAIGLNFTIRIVMGRRADAHEQRVRDAAIERMYPERFAEEDEGA